MKVVISGSSGLIGSALTRTLTAGGVHIVRLVRTPPHMAEAKIHWDPEAGTIDSVKLEGADAVIAPLKDLRAVFGMPDDPRTAAQRFAEAYRVPLVVLTLGENGSLAYDGEFHAQPVYPTETHDRIGSGDAFAAGFLYGWDERGVAYGLLCGNASAALKQTYRGDVTWAGLEELLELVENEFVDPRRVKR